MTKLAIVRRSNPEDMAKPNPNRISQYVLRVMEEEGWTQKDVLDNAKAQKIKLRQSTLSEVVTGESSDPQILTLLKISKSLLRPLSEMATAIEQDPEEATSERSKEADFAVMSRVYEQLESSQKTRADDLIGMVKEKLIKLLRQQGQTNQARTRK